MSLMKGKFWKDQPVGLCRTGKDRIGIIEQGNVENVKKERHSLPTGLSWKVIDDETDETTLTLLRDFLNNNYVSNDDGLFRLTYDVPFLKHFISQGKPGWSVIIVEDETGSIVGSIMAVLRKLIIRGVEIHESAEVNLLCVRPDYRGKNLAGTLISEIRRIIGLDGYFTAIHTSGTMLPQKPFCTSRYFHKLLDIEKLNAVGFTEFPEDDLANAIKHHEFKPVKKQLNPLCSWILRYAGVTDAPSIATLFANDSMKYMISEYIDEEVIKRFLDAPYMDNFVIEEINMIGKKRKIVGYVSIYHMNLLCLKGDASNYLATSYIYYHCGKILPCIGEIFAVLKKKGKSVVNCFNMGTNKDLINIYNMTPGTGHLHYYMYNYRLPLIPTEELSYMVL